MLHFDLFKLIFEGAVPVFPCAGPLKNLAAYVGKQESFLNWFAGSKIVDCDGNPLPTFHGTKRDYSELQSAYANTGGTSVGINNIGFFFTTSPSVANIYASKGFDTKKGAATGGNIRYSFLKVTNPYVLTSEKQYWKMSKISQNEIELFLTDMKSKGQDGIIMPSVWRGNKNGSWDIVVFDQNQISKGIIPPTLTEMNAVGSGGISGGPNLPIGQTIQDKMHHDLWGDDLPKIFKTQSDDLHEFWNLDSK